MTASGHNEANIGILKVNDEPTEVEANEAAEAASGDALQPSIAPGDTSALPAVPAASAEPAPVEFSWQASEYVQHHKTTMWYVTVVLVVLGLSMGAFLLHFWLSIGVFIAMGLAIIVYGMRPPRTLTYELSADGMHIDGRLFPYKNFHSFSVVRDIAWHAIDLEPTQRFMPRLSVLFNDEDFEPIVSHLLQHLPRTDRQPDVIERVTRYLRF